MTGAGMSLAGMGAAWASAAATPPPAPDGDTARAWLIGELSAPAYQAARPTWFDIAADRLRHWIVGLFAHASAPMSPLLILVALLLVASAVTVAFVVFGVPRRRRRRAASAQRSVLFGLRHRSAAQLRADARQAAARGDWARAVCDLFRAIARTADDDGLVTLTPGTTAPAFARQAARRLPRAAAIPDVAAGDAAVGGTPEAGALETGMPETGAPGARAVAGDAALRGASASAAQGLGAAARLFDDVRYAGAAAGRADYEAMLRLAQSMAAAGRRVAARPAGRIHEPAR